MMLPSPQQRCTLTHGSGAGAVVTPYGAQVLGWRSADGRERLFLSAAAAYREGVAIRGGIPVIFPQFAAEGPLPKHGFARTATWRPLMQSATMVVLALDETLATHMLWPHRYRATLTLTLSADELQIALGIDNRDRHAFAFTAALHTYLAVDDIADARIAGLQQLRYRDSAAGHREAHQHDALPGFGAEFDRVYFDVPTELALQAGARGLRVRQSGFRDTVVWNPGPVKAQTLDDLANDGWRRFVCIEAATVEEPVRLAAGDRWVGTQRLISADIA